jgi:hypothetical protein
VTFDPRPVSGGPTRTRDVAAHYFDFAERGVKTSQGAGRVSLVRLERLGRDHILALNPMSLPKRARWALTFNIFPP